MDSVSLYVGIQHDSNLTFYVDGKFRIIEIERIFGQRYADLDYCSFEEKVYTFELIKKIVQKEGFWKQCYDFLLVDNLNVLNLGQDPHYETLVAFRRVFSVQEVVYTSFHHLYHAQMAFNDSKFENALIFSYDGGGQDGRFAVYEASENSMKRISGEEDKEQSFCNYYFYPANYISEIGGNVLKYSLAAPGKLMGLSGYGNYQREIFKKCYDFLKNATYENVNSGKYKLLGAKFNELKGRDSYDWAYNMQLAFEEVFIELFRKYFNAEKHSNVCLTGGGALNVLLNERLTKEYPNTRFFVPSSPGDSGQSYGMLLSHFGIKNEEDPMYLGCPVIDSEILPEILMYRPWRHATPELIASELKGGKIIGVCRSRSEVGPRALGNRTILADPGYQNMKETLNAKVKHREWFRPFAPVCQAEKAHKFFETRNNADYRYMSFAPNVREEYRKILPSITHIDGSSRLQTLERKTNSFIYDILEEFEKLSGYPILINTSFNIRGKSILTHYQAALQILDSTEMDGVILENYYITK
jgi:carbamoyltransferase